MKNVFNLSDFPEKKKIFVNPYENFRRKLFDKALKNSNESIEELDKKLNYNQTVLYRIKEGFWKKGVLNNIRLDLFYRLAYIAKISSVEANKNIKFLRYGRNSVDVTNIFPLKYDYRLAILIGHATGDGHINGNYCNFQYRNSSKELINKVYSLILDIFNIKSKIYPAKDGTSQIEVPSIVGYILYKAGAPLGNKINTKFEVPKWIMQGDKNIFCSYLGALVDDEFFISIKKQDWIWSK